MACCFIQDVVAYFKNQRSPLHISGLDAEKCFDRIWHPGLLFKLRDVFPASQWMFLHKWYNNLHAVVKWNGHFSHVFPVTRGTRQGSILSPALFNIFIDGLLSELADSEQGVMIGKHRFSSCAFADDVSIMSSNANGLQHLLDICDRYAQKWGFKLSTKKSKCMIFGDSYYSTPPTFFLGANELECVDKLEILGVIFSKDFDTKHHVESRVSKCRKTFYSLSKCGMKYPGLSTEGKSYLWKSICQPSLLYGHECISLSDRQITRLDSTQGSLIKQSLGLGKKSRHSKLLSAMRIKPISQLIKERVGALLSNMCSVDNPGRDMIIHLLSEYMSTGKLYSGTLLDRAVAHGISPIKAVFEYKKPRYAPINDGIVDSLNRLLCHEHFLKPYSDEHTLVYLLTRSF